MALCHLRNLPLFAWRELQPVPSVSRLAEERLRWNSQRSPSCRVLLLECSAKKSRGSRNTKTTRSDADLCNELRHFVLAMGLPEDHVPSTKELLEHGRKDLAYIVRRRGHKEITKLLMNPTIGDTAMEKHVENDCHFGKVSTEESIEFQETLDIYDMEAESSQEGTTSCRQSSELKIAGGIEDSLERQDAVICNGHKFNSSMNNADGADENNMGSQLLSPLRRGQYSSRFNNTFSVQFLDELQHSLRDDVLEEILCNSDFDDSKGSDLAEEKANEVEVDHLKELLRQKESELALLKQQIEEEKFALSTMQNKAEAEITKVQNIIATKDHELQATEESLSGLKEVLIEYWGNGETVEVAGSFNGWQQRVKMDPHTSSNPNGTRESILWSTILWLYPGIYEIKFVVDGHWKIDAQRELVPRGAITNNVLRVEG